MSVYKETEEIKNKKHFKKSTDVDSVRMLYISCQQFTLTFPIRILILWMNTNKCTYINILTCAM